LTHKDIKFITIKVSFCNRLWRHLTIFILSWQRGSQGQKQRKLFHTNGKPLNMETWE